jgi:hypothetical protein
VSHFFGFCPARGSSDRHVDTSQRPGPCDNVPRSMLSAQDAPGAVHFHTHNEDIFARAMQFAGRNEAAVVRARLLCCRRVQWLPLYHQVPEIHACSVSNSAPVTEGKAGNFRFLKPISKI